MKRAFTLSFAIGLAISASAIEARADLARPTGTPIARHHTEFAVEPDGKAYDARLQISQSTLRTLQTQLAFLPSEQIPAQGITNSPKRTVIAGLSLFLAISFGGIWLVRSQSSRSQKAISAVLLGCAIVGAAAILTRGNAGPPPALRWKSLAQNLTNGKTTYGSVSIEIVPEGEGVKLIIPQPPKSPKGADE